MDADIIKPVYEDMVPLNESSDEIGNIHLEGLYDKVTALVDKVLNVLASKKAPENEVLNNKIREALLSLLINVAKAQEKLLRRKSIHEARGNVIEVRELLRTAERLGVITGSRIKTMYNLLDKVLEDLYVKRKK